MKKNHIHIRWQAVSNPVALNLSKGFTPVELPTLEYKTFQFLGGEPHFQILDDTSNLSHLVITQRYNTVEDLFAIILANDAARRAGFKHIELVLPYFPAARQDRVCNEGEPLTIKLFTDMINGCGFDHVHILSPHSEVTPALLNNVVVHDELDYVTSIVMMSSAANFNIVCPDAGAGKRVGKVVKHLTEIFPLITFNLIRCEKERDVTDGKLKGFYVQADDLGGHPTLIVDDINAMGGTFIGLGEELRKKNCGKLMLFTSHADCAAGIANICNNFDHYYTTNSKRDYKLDDTFPEKNFTCFDFTL